MCCEPGQGARTTLHAVVRFQCAAGMKLEGEADRATCTAAGRWSHPVPRCLAPCILPDIQHGNIRDSTGILMSRPQQIYFCLLMIFLQCQCVKNLSMLPILTGQLGGSERGRQG